MKDKRNRRCEFYVVKGMAMMSMYECSECGAIVFGYKGPVDFASPNSAPRFCSCCGAKAVGSC